MSEMIAGNLESKQHDTTDSLKYAKVSCTCGFEMDFGYPVTSTTLREMRHAHLTEVFCHQLGISHKVTIDLDSSAT